LSKVLLSQGEYAIAFIMLLNLALASYSAGSLNYYRNSIRSLKRRDGVNKSKSQVPKSQLLTKDYLTIPVNTFTLNYTPCDPHRQYHSDTSPRTNFRV
jgi:hypothetical protein